MGKARHLANLLNADGDVKSDHLDNVPASNDASALTTGTLPAARLPGNITDTGTEGTRVASGTTAQRGTTAGQVRYNTTTTGLEYYDGTSVISLDKEPTISATTPDSFEVSALPANLTITGTNFKSGGTTVTFIGNDGTETNSSSITVNSTTQITAQVPDTITSANEPYDVKVTLGTGGTVTTTDAFNIDAAPVFSVASGSLATLNFGGREASNVTNITATDDEGDSITFSITSGSAPTGLTLGSDGVWSGTADSVESDTTSTFTVTATDGTNSNTRQYSITVLAPVDTVATGGTTTTYNDGTDNWKAHTFTSSGTFTITTAGDVNPDIEYLIVAGGAGGGGNRHATGCGGGGGAGGMLVGAYSNFSAQAYTVTVGGGGSGGGSTGNGSDGSSSSIFSISATGGGGGGSGQNSNGRSGGSGGGGGYQRSGGSGTSGQGNSGASGQGGGAPYFGGGGGGKNSGGSSRNAGSGLANSYNNTSVTYAIGGQGGAENGHHGATGGSTNSGGGGGGGAGIATSSGKTGNSGIVVVRYKVSSI